MHIRSEIIFIKPYTASGSHKIEVPAVGKIPAFPGSFKSVLCRNVCSRNCSHGTWMLPLPPALSVPTALWVKLWQKREYEEKVESKSPPLVLTGLLCYHWISLCHYYIQTGCWQSNCLNHRFQNDALTGKYLPGCCDDQASCILLERTKSQCQVPLTVTSSEARGVSNAPCGTRLYSLTGNLCTEVGHKILK